MPEIMTIKGSTKSEFLRTARNKRRREVAVGRRKAYWNAADLFWVSLDEARHQLAALVGANWHLRPDCYRWGRLPAAMCSRKGNAITHRWSRDQKIPDAAYWPNKKLPDVAIEYTSGQRR